VQERRQQITTVRRQESSLAPLILGVALLAIAGGGALAWFLWPEQETAAPSAAPAPAPAPKAVAAAPPESKVAPTPPPSEPRLATTPAPSTATTAAPPVAEPAPAPASPPTPAPAPAAPPLAAPAPPAPVAVAPPIETLPPAPEQPPAVLARPAPAPEPVASRRDKPPPSDPAAAFAQFTKAAAQGDAAAQFRLALAYRDGIGTKAAPVRALAWLMHAGARGHAEAVAERDRALASYDDTSKVQADSLSRSLPVPMPAGWLVDPARGVRVWSPSWYRNGTFKVSIEGASAGGGVHGPGKVALTATLYGRSDRIFEGVFTGGLMLDARLRAMQDPRLQLLESDEIRLNLDAAAASYPTLQRLWRQTKLQGLEIEACPKAAPQLYAVMAPDFVAIEDAQAKAAAIGAAQAIGALCPLRPDTPAHVFLLPPEHHESYDRGEMTYRPRLAELQLYGFDQPTAAWSITLRNHAREAHLRQEQEAEQQRRRAEREQKEARATAAAIARSMPDIRGFKLGLSFEAFKAAIGGDAATWLPKLKDDHRMPDYMKWEQKVTLTDGAAFTGVFSSSQNGSRLMSLGYEQHLREGPPLETMRQQLFAKYGPADEDVANGTWLTWWLRSAVDDEPKGALLRARIETDRDRRATALRLTVSDINLARRDEQQAAAARRQAEREAFEKQKSDKPKF
jgi:hypothetical protein